MEAYAAKAEAERIELDRIAAEERKLDARMKERLKTLAAMDIDGDLMNIRLMPDEQFDTFVKSEQAKIAARAAAAKAAEDARIEAAKIADEQRVAREKAEKEAEKARAELAATKKAAELALAKAAEDERLKAESDRAALLAPDRDKLAFLVTIIYGIKMPELQTPEAGRIATNVKTLLRKVTKYIEEEADKL
jgi:hypothetical protein